MAARVPRIGVGLFVSRLHWTVSGACLRKHFEKFGTVLFSEVHIDVKTGLHRGFGWVRMSSEQEVLQALDYKRHNIEGYEATVTRDKRDGPFSDELNTDLISSPSDGIAQQATPTTPDHVTQATPQ